MALALFVSIRAAAQNELHNNGALLYISTGAAVQVNGNFINTAAGANLQNGGTITVTGSITNDQVFTAYMGKLTFKGTSAQTLNGSADFLTENFEMDNAAGATLNTTLKVNGTNSFTNGILLASNVAHPLWFTSTATHSGVSDASHVNGYVVKEGTGSFTYPVGDGNSYQPIALDATSNATGVRVRYNMSDAGSHPFTGASPLLYYNTLEHWDMTPITAATGRVTIFWDSYRNVGIGNTADLRVAHLSGNNWLNAGATNVTGTIGAGSVTSEIINTWSPFTLGSMSITSTLPVSWLSVNGNLNASKQSAIHWRVNEYNVIDYQIEKSDNGINFRKVATIAGKGNGENGYTYTDPAALQHTTYYRIKQSDLDGKFSYSSVIKLTTNSITELIVYPTPFNESFTILSPVAQTASIISLDGKFVQTLQLKEGSNLVYTGLMSSGVYILSTADKTIKKIIKQ